MKQELEGGNETGAGRREWNRSWREGVKQELEGGNETGAGGKE